MKRNKGLRYGISMMMILVLLFSIVPTGNAAAESETQPATVKTYEVPIMSGTRITTQPQGELSGEKWTRLANGGGWKDEGQDAIITLRFPQKIHVNALTTYYFDKQHNDNTAYRVEGQDGGKWKDIDLDQVQTSEKQQIRAVTPGRYDAIRLTYKAVQMLPSRTLEIATIHMLSDLPYISDLQAEPLSDQAVLTWTPVPGADKYIVRYGSEIRNYTNTVELSPQDIQSGNRWTIRNLPKEQIMHVLIAPVVNGQVGNYSSDQAILATNARIIPQGTEFSSNSYRGYLMLGNIADGKIDDTWGSAAYYKEKLVTYGMKFHTPLHLRSVQIIAAVPRNATNSYTVYGFKDGQKKMIGQQTYDLTKQTGPVRLEPIAVTVGFYDEIHITAQSTDTNELYEILWDSDKDSVTGLQAVAGNGQTTLSWNAVDDVDQYVIEYSPVYDEKDIHRVEVGADAYQGYAVKGLINGQKYAFQVFPRIGDQMLNASDQIIGAATAGVQGQAVPSGTIVSSSEHRDPYQIVDGDRSTYYYLQQGEAITLSFPQPISLTGLQLTSGTRTHVKAQEEHQYTIYGLQNKQWIPIGSGALTAIHMFSEDDVSLLQDPIAVQPGMYESIMIIGKGIDESYHNLNLSDVSLLYGQLAIQPSNVTDDTYARAGTVSQDTYW
ncbi:hypothetical protein [Paenibacillus sp. WLX2291]|uniref:fibronectin type III domain-containing protein n=1 Tax=Paenibacillus sp. WLX2291 TaxID=3296934 RepID=UPI00398428F3